MRIRYLSLTTHSLAPLAAGAVILLAALAPPAAAATDAKKCEAAVELAAGKYARCRLKAESRFTKNGDAVALGQCAHHLRGQARDRVRQCLRALERELPDGRAGEQLRCVHPTVHDRGGGRRRGRELPGLR
jgi:hypothetical protein